MARARNRRMKSKLLALNIDRQKRAVEQLLQNQQRELIPHLEMLEKLSKAKGMSLGSNVLLEIEGELVPGLVKSKCAHPDGSIDILTEAGETHVFCETSRVVLQQTIPKPVPPVLVVPHTGGFIPMYRPMYDAVNQYSTLVY